jgi:branched-subunit amino acid ABC-type transport system permease component
MGPGRFSSRQTCPLGRVAETGYGRSVTVVFLALGTFGSVLLVVIGLQLILGLMNIINLAHTGLMALGVYIAVTVTQHGESFWLAVLAGAAAAGVAGFVIELLVIRRIYARPLESILATWGISLALINLLQTIYGPASLGIPSPVTSSLTLFGAPYEVYRLILVAIALAIVCGLGLWARLTRVGLVARMVMANPDLARGIGINTVRVRQLTFIVGTTLAGAAGALLGPLSSIDNNFGSVLLVPAFLAVMLSGTSLLGMTIATAILATVQAVFSVEANPTYATIVVILVAVALLRLRPEGMVWHRM